MSVPQTDVCLCVMPFCPTRAPSSGISLLKEELKGNGFSTYNFYFNLKFLKMLGLHLHDRVSGDDGILHRLAGEIIFSEYLFGKFAELYNSIHSILRDTKDSRDVARIVIDEIERAKAIVPKFIAECADEIVSRQPKLVGFSVSYYQTCSSLLLAKKIKEKVNVPIIFGGSCCEAEMGRSLLSHFPQVDYVCSGDGDISFIDFTKAILKDHHHHRVEEIDGIVSRKSSPLQVHMTKPVLEMDSLPLPNYQEFFQVIMDLPEIAVEVKIPMETSRGCWWGEISHCKFCGLNGGTMKFRSKSADRVINEIEHITNAYKIKSFQFADNILDPKYFRFLFPTIANRNMGLWMFYETKSNLSKEQLETMKDAGVSAIQPGIESLSDTILDLMGKGATMLQNVYLLKICKEMGIWAFWNIITGFPGESPKEYAQMQDIVPLLFHLDPPELFGKFQLSRFSPYFIEPAKYGITNIRPQFLYSLIYPFNPEVTANLAYYFDHDYADGRDVESYTSSLEGLVNEWKDLWKANPPELNMIEANGMTIIKDTRPCAVHQIHYLGKVEAYIYSLCASPHNFSKIIEETQKNFPHLDANEIHDILEDFCEKKIVLKNGNEYLSLATKINFQ